MADDTIHISRGELRELIREVMVEVLAELSDGVFDPDQGLEFRPEIAARLRAFMREEKPQGQSASDVARELGLDV